MVRHGTLAERLGSGLQHHLQRFESARYLLTNPYYTNLQVFRDFLFLFIPTLFQQVLFLDQAQKLGTRQKV